MFALLVLACDRLSENLKGQGHIFIASFCIGFVDGIAEQLKLSRAEVAKTVDSTAMIKLNSRQEEANIKMKELYPKLFTSKGRSKSHIDRNAHHMGVESGKNIHLGSSLNGGIKLLEAGT